MQCLLKGVLISSISLGFVGCSNIPKYCLITEHGIEYSHIKSLESCNLINEQFFKLKGICIIE